MNLKNNITEKKVVNLVKSVVLKGPKDLHVSLIKEIERDYVLKCLKTNVVSSVGEFTNKFEKLLKNFTKAKYVLLVNSGTSSLHLSMIGCDLKKMMKF